MYLEHFRLGLGDGISQRLAARRVRLAFRQGKQILRVQRGSYDGGGERSGVKRTRADDTEAESRTRIAGVMNAPIDQRAGGHKRSREDDEAGVPPAKVAAWEDLIEDAPEGQSSSSSSTAVPAGSMARTPA